MSHSSRSAWGCRTTERSSSYAAFGGNPDLASGNVMRSDLANIGLIVGVTSVMRPLDVHTRVVWREAPIKLLVMAISLLLMP